MNITRREFVVLSSALACGCQAGGGGGSQVSLPPQDVDVGPAGQYASDGVYDSFRADGFFIVRKQGTLFVLSSTCTHRECPVRAAGDGTFKCKCHGSSFDPRGHVTKGPATRDLPLFASEVNAQGRLI